MYFDRYDICHAYYRFAEQYHGGQYTKEYKIFSRLDKIDFEPPYGNMSENATLIFHNLVERFHAKVGSSIRNCYL